MINKYKISDMMTVWHKVRVGYLLSCSGVNTDLHNAGIHYTRVHYA